MSASTQASGEYFGGRPQSEIHQFLCDASDSLRACENKPVALALDNGLSPPSDFKYASGIINDRHVVFQIVRDLYSNEDPGLSVGFDSDGNKYHGNVTPTYARLADGTFSVEESFEVDEIRSLNKKALPLSDMLEKVESSKLSVYLNRQIEADDKIRYYAFQKDEKSLLATFPNAETDKAFHKDFDGGLAMNGSVVAYPFDPVILRGALEYSNSLVNEMNSHQIKETENAMSARTEQNKKPHFNTRTANQLSQQLRDGTAPMQRQGVQDIPYNPATGRTFHGINAMSLMMQDRKDDRWFTFDEASACGYKVKSGEIE